MSDGNPSDFEWAEGWELSSPVGRDRREAERILSYWEHKLAEFGSEEMTISALDLTRINSKDWANRFLISVDPVIERSALLMYGPKFAELMALSEQPRPELPMMRQLPRRYGEVFMRGCGEAQKAGAPVRLEGEVDRYDNRVEQYRAVFIPIGVKPNSLTCFAFGAFSNRILPHG